MNTDRLGKLMEAYRLADENAGNDGGEERAKHEGEIRALIGGGEAAPDPVIWRDHAQYPDVGTVTSAFARGGWVVSETASLDDCARTTGDTVSNARPTTRVTARL